MDKKIKERIEMINRGEVPVGYKKTKVGIIPEDWEVKRLGDLGLFFRGKGIPKSKILDQGVGCVTYGEIYTTYNYTFKIFESYTDIKTSKNSFAIRKNDVLFAGSGETLAEIGKCVAYLGEEGGYVGGDIIVFRPKNTDGAVLGYLLNQDYVKHQKYKLGQGHSVVHIYVGNLETILIPALNKIEQEKIAEILSTWDKAIELKEKLIEQKEEQKKGLMQKLLTGKVRLPGFNGEWIKKPISDICKIVSGGTPPTGEKEYWNGEIPWCIPTDITASGKEIIETARYITEEGLKKSSISLLPVNSIIMCSRATIGPRAINKVPMATNQGFKSFICNETVYFEFLYYLIEIYIRTFIRKASGSTFLEINKNEVENTIVKLPSLPEQIAIAQVLTTADKEINLLKQELELIKFQKKGLMQLLLTGIVRVNVA